MTAMATLAGRTGPSLGLRPWQNFAEGLLAPPSSSRG
jgi:hypothetical protein